MPLDERLDLDQSATMTLGEHIEDLRRRLIFSVAGLVPIVVAALIFVGESREYGDKLLGELPAWVFQSILPVAFLLIGYRYALWCLKRLRALFRREPAA